MPISHSMPSWSSAQAVTSWSSSQRRTAGFISAASRSACRARSTSAAWASSTGAPVREEVAQVVAAEPAPTDGTAQPVNQHAPLGARHTGSHLGPGTVESCHGPTVTQALQRAARCRRSDRAPAVPSFSVRVEARTTPIGEAPGPGHVAGHEVDVDPVALVVGTPHVLGARRFPPAADSSTTVLGLDGGRGMGTGHGGLAPFDGSLEALDGDAGLDGQLLDANVRPVPGSGDAYHPVGERLVADCHAVRDRRLGLTREIRLEPTESVPGTGPSTHAPATAPGLDQAGVVLPATPCHPEDRSTPRRRCQWRIVPPLV